MAFHAASVVMSAPLARHCVSNTKQPKSDVEIIIFKYSSPPGKSRKKRVVCPTEMIEATAPRSAALDSLSSEPTKSS